MLYLFVNGQFVGMGKDCRLPSEFAISAQVTCGQKNHVCAVMVKWPDATFIEDQDQCWMAGLQLTVQTGFPRQPEEGWTVETRLLDPRSQGDSRFRPQSRFDVTVKKTLLRSVELPNLYTPVVSLKNPQVKIVESASSRIGFRSVEVRDHNLLINDRRVLIHGVNRHDHDHRKGKALDRETMRLDALTMKRFNFNAVRCSHYPNDPRWSSAFLDRAVRIVEGSLPPHPPQDQIPRVLVRSRSHRGLGTITPPGQPTGKTKYSPVRGMGRDTAT